MKTRRQRFANWLLQNPLTPGMQLNAAMVDRIDGFNYPARPWPMVWVADWHYAESDLVRFVPLTLSGLLLAVARNRVILWWWAAERALHWAGFLEPVRAEVPNSGWWRWCFWRTLRERAITAERAK